jgi:hypothetical protein
MQFRRFSFLATAAVAALGAIGLACTSSPGSELDNGTFTAPTSVVQGQTFQASYAANTPTVYPDIKVVPVSTALIGYPDAGPGFVGERPGQAALYAISGGLVLGYQTITVEASK